MRLSDYLQRHKINRTEFATAMGVDPISVYRWERGIRMPVRHFARIAEFTGNEVTANDFVQADEAAQ